MDQIKNIIVNKARKADFRNKHEFQAFGNRLADELGDNKHRTLYLMLAKSEDRNLLETARLFALGNEKSTTKGKLFMWKLKELRKARDEKEQKQKVE
ncbi:hypothetical protein KAZ57_02640 [Patescibacteria group bacterium]|nr:hypothetical protein [Patescibacteria group bacterium]